MSPEINNQGELIAPGIMETGLETFLDRDKEDGPMIDALLGAS
jgi:hypothetical protein